MRAAQRFQAVSRIRARQLATDSFTLIGFQDEPTTYTFTLDEKTFENGELTVTVTETRSGDSAIIDDTLTELFVGGTRVDFNDGADPSPFGTDLTLSGPASGGDSFAVVISTDLFGGAQARLTGTVEEAGPAPRPDIAVSGLGMSPAEVATGGTATAVVDVTNEGGAQGTRTFDVLVDGQQRAQVDTGFLQPGESTTVRTDLTFQSAGTHTVSVGGQQATVTVTEPEPEPEPGQLDLGALDAPGNVVVGTTFDVTTTVSCSGDTRCDPATATLFAGGQQVGQAGVLDLAPGEQSELSFSVTAEQAGELDLAVEMAGQRRTATVTVEAPQPGQLNLGAVDAPGNVVVGTTFDVTTTVSCSGDTRCDPATATLFAGGQQVGQAGVLDLAPGEQSELSFSVTAEQAGDLQLAVELGDRRETATVAVEEALGGGPGGPLVTVGCASAGVLNRDAAPHDTPADVRAVPTLQSNADRDVDVTYDLEIGAQTFGPFDVTVPAGASIEDPRQVTIDPSVAKAGDHPVAVQQRFGQQQRATCGTITVAAPPDEQEEPGGIRIGDTEVDPLIGVGVLLAIAAVAVLS